MTGVQTCALPIFYFSTNVKKLDKKERINLIVVVRFGMLTEFDTVAEHSFQSFGVLADC